MIKSTVKAAATLAFAVGISCGAHAARTVCVSEQTDSTVTLKFGGVDDLDYGLFLAHGATDGGEDKAKWDFFEKIADIACNQTSFTYEVPSALRDGRPMRFFLMQTLGVHMAKEFASITSTGAQWINTGVAPATNNWITDFRFKTGAIADGKAFFGQTEVFHNIITTTAFTDRLLLWIMAIILVMPVRQWLIRRTDRLTMTSPTLNANIKFATKLLVSAAILIVSVALLVGATNNAFLYTRF